MRRTRLSGSAATPAGHTSAYDTSLASICRTVAARDDWHRASHNPPHTLLSQKHEDSLLGRLLLRRVDQAPLGERSCDVAGGGCGETGSRWGYDSFAVCGGGGALRGALGEGVLRGARMGGGHASRTSERREEPHGTIHCQPAPHASRAWGERRARERGGIAASKDGSGASLTAGQVGAVVRALGLSLDGLGHPAEVLGERLLGKALRGLRTTRRNALSICKGEPRRRRHVTPMGGRLREGGAP
jgi:hypothetical protein